MNAEFQRIAKRYKTFFIDQCKEIEKTIEWERLEISSKKIGDIKGTFLARMSTTRDRNDKDLTEAEDIKKR